jgi:hypothetical protein
MDIDPHDTRPPLVDRLFSKTPFDEIFGNLPEILLEETDFKLREAERYLLKWGGCRPFCFYLKKSDGNG